MSSAPKDGMVLIIDDDDDILTAARLLLKKHVAVVHTESNPDCIPTRLEENRYDVIFLDMNFTKGVSSGQEGFDWLERILEIDVDAVVVLITAYGDVETAVKAIKAGATDFVLKPWQNEKLLATFTSGLKLRQSRREVSSLRSRQQILSADLDQPFHDIIGTSLPMRQVFAMIEKVAGTEANVLILGENGTGKELVARAIHRQSGRVEEVFMSVDMGAITESLFESELFGYMKGAFTDAKGDRAGRFEVASGGTLFLDEIGNLPIPLQVKLLSVLENRQVTRLGSTVPRQIDVRLICATNLPLKEMINDKRFRQDLFYRINTVEIALPPLRERVEDIPLLAEHFVGQYAQKYKHPAKRISSDAMQRLKFYHWPGNIRELKHAIERAIILSDTTTLSSDDFLLPSDKSREQNVVQENFRLEDVERGVITKVLHDHDGNVSRAARALGLSRAALYRRIEKYGLQTLPD
ncbi:MAG: sigma-54-dependent Fis family transcriptional regulator [Fidelibacterota bacterium]|nr:MAG: sigma-54-dependent Fis family transcriptional regulator [Candidatus Neomarinimicrobiota bacterium]